MSQNNSRQGRWGGRGLLALILALSMGVLSACDDLLEVELPHLLTDAALEGERSAELQINSAIALFECSYSSFSNTKLGDEDVLESIAGAGGDLYRFEEQAESGVCDSAVNDNDWLSAMLSSRALLSNDPAYFAGTSTVPESCAGGEPCGVYDKIQREWELAPVTEARLSAIASLYTGAILAHWGEYLCEAAIDGSDLLTPTQLLDMAEEWITDRALLHIGQVSGGDFEMPNGIASSAENMAIALRARIRWANGDLAGAASDASTIPDGFTAWVTRETGETRRNKTYETAQAISYGGMLGVNDWWDGSLYRANPATGEQWPSPIPHTGYIFLGIMPDGRTLEAGNIPVRWAQEDRDPDDNPISLENGAVPDTRVPHIKKGTQGPGPAEVPNRYDGQDSNEPLASWQEMRLIEADYQLSLGTVASRAEVISIINDLRTYEDRDLPEVSGTYLASLTDGSNDQEEVRHLLLEERRRELFTHGGRFLSTKIQNTDVFWFPRDEGNTPFQGYQYGGAVRTLFVVDEYTQNPYFVDRGGLDARGTGCDPAERPYLQ